MRNLRELKNKTRGWQAYWVREALVDAIRDYFKSRGFHEVETPLLLPAPSTEPFLEVFETELVDNLGKRREAFLPSSPEFAMKKMLSSGLGSIFQTILQGFSL